jgi:hypothetical protein
MSFSLPADNEISKSLARGDIENIQQMVYWLRSNQRTVPAGVNSALRIILTYILRAGLG